MPTVSTVPSTERLTTEALTHLVHHINSWSQHQDGETPYTVEHFTTYDPDRSLYGSFIVRHQSNLLLHISCTDGDEGGPSELICSIYDDEITAIVHVFDTMPALIYTEHHYTCTPDNDYRTNLIKEG